jgi:hypothetical protein
MKGACGVRHRRKAQSADKLKLRGAVAQRVVPWNTW